MVAMLCEEQLGGLIFFQDPLDSHPHVGCIESLVRNAKIYNIMHATTTVTATMLMNSLRMGLENGKSELFPSFFLSLQCPSVARYLKAQSEVISEVSGDETGKDVNKKWAHALTGLDGSETDLSTEGSF